MEVETGIAFLKRRWGLLKTATVDTPDDVKAPILFLIAFVLALFVFDWLFLPGFLAAAIGNG